ncbi:MAG: type II toxin-antitoxin system PemK/MazF family toxin [Geobacteraceae bacterium]|nr:type II toxin-antitoxin system PemK/MazF family toxin [Geobacteraceae bacterium]
MGKEIKQYRIYLINLDPTVGHELRKTRPCLVVSPDEMNRHLRTIMIATMTNKSHDYPSRVTLRFQEKPAWIVHDQIRTVDRERLVKVFGKLDQRHICRVKDVIQEMLLD